MASMPDNGELNPKMSLNAFPAPFPAPPIDSLSWAATVWRFTNDSDRHGVSGGLFGGRPQSAVLLMEPHMALRRCLPSFAVRAKTACEAQWAT